MRRASTSTKESSDHGAAPPAVSLGHPHRRMSRMDPSFNTHAARRMSMYRRPSIAGSQRTDLSHSVVVPVKLQNTYRLQPDEDDKFNTARVSKMLSSILKSFLEGEEYEAKKCTGMAQNLTDVIKNRIKDMGFTRYKLVCHVMIGENGNQGIQSASRCVWDTQTDNFAQGTYSNNTLFAVASVFGCYYE